LLLISIYLQKFDELQNRQRVYFLMVTRVRVLLIQKFCPILKTIISTFARNIPFKQCYVQNQEWILLTVAFCNQYEVNAPYTPKARLNSRLSNN